jgi:alkanesulfonate monooxygenase SsuD/methylene tetrahydromethanopterin reductase-like flavin-dependent oxidoreductase (luciferase family)
MPERKVLFGVGLGTFIGAEVVDVAQTLQCAAQAERDGLDLFAVADHPYYGNRLDAHATLGFILGRTSHIAGVATVTNLPNRPAPMLARAITSLSALSDGRVVLGIGAGGMWDEIVKLGVPRLSPGSAVRALEEAITLVKALSGGGDPVTFDGEFYKVAAIDPAPVATPQIWTGSVGPKSLAVTGRLADGWIPGYAADWLSPRYRESRPHIDDAATGAGRDPAEIRTIFNFGGRITTSPQTPTRDDDGRWLGGSVEQWVDELTAAVLEHDAGGFVYRADADTPSDVALGRWAREVVPAVREAVAAKH